MQGPDRAGAAGKIKESTKSESTIFKSGWI